MAKNTRKGHGEGTIYQREDGYWIGQMTTGRTIEGKQERKTFSAKSQKEVIAKMKDYQYKQERGELPKTNMVSLSDWMSTWLETYKKPKIRQTTYENYDTLTKTHIIRSPFGKTKIQKLTTDQIQKFMRAKAEKGKVTIIKEEIAENGQTVLKERKVESPLSNRTINLLHFLIQSALNQAVKNNIVSKNVAISCELYKNDKKEVKPLTSDEIKQLLETLTEHRMYAAILLDLYSGLRRGELLALKWDRVDLKEGTITIAENLVRVKGGSIIHKPKTKSSIRTINLPKKVIGELKLHQQRQEAEKKAKEEKEKGSYQDEGFVFCQPNGKRIQPRNLQRMFSGWVIKAGLPKETRLHDLRHTFVTMMISAGVDIKTAQSFTGHSDTRTLLETYSHFVTESQKQAAMTLNNLIPDVSSH